MVDVPRISVVIPCYNQGQFLRHAVQSVQAQTLRSYEIIVVDDGSTDDTASVIQGFGDELAYILQDNAGPSAARNAGIKRARGEYVAFLDADDWWDATFLESLHATAISVRRPAVVYARQMLVGNGFSAYESSILNGPLRGNPLEALIMWPALTSDAMLVSRSALFQAGLFDPALRGHEDWDLHLRLAALGLPFILVDKVLAYYRQHSSGAHCNIDLMDDTLLSILRKWEGYGGARFQRRRRYAVANAIVARATRLLQQERTAEGITYLTQEVSRMPALLCGSPFRFLRFVRILSDHAPGPQRQPEDLVERVLAELSTNERWVQDELASTLYASAFLELALQGRLSGAIRLASRVVRSQPRLVASRSFVWWLMERLRLEL